MDTLSVILPILLYILLAALIITLIILSIKIIQLVDRANGLITNLEEKANTLNRFFSMIDTVTDAVSGISDKMVDGISGFLMRIFSRKKRKESDEYE